ncbi:hypothetical protein [Tenacibaculum amylolyticum]|uniref:hypothetical protein n=1 Tax=Tenacibaculum amylolyticum TaxID=104269 RepID=UPI0038934577
MKNMTKIYFFTVLFVICNITCSTSQENKRTITVPVFYKNFTKKNGITTDKKELYIQHATKGFYVKFCESKIRRQDLETFLAKNKKETKKITVEVAFKNGVWDICDDNYLQQSRKGDYAIIYKIIKEK